MVGDKQIIKSPSAERDATRGGITVKILCKGGIKDTNYLTVWGSFWITQTQKTGFGWLSGKLELQCFWTEVAVRQILYICVYPKMEITCNPQLSRQDDYQHQHFHMKYTTDVYNLALTYFCINCSFLVLSKRQVISLLIQEVRKQIIIAGSFLKLS